MHIKSILTLFLILFSLFGCKKFDRLSNDPYSERVKLFKDSNLTASNVFIGDSITEGGSWQDLLSNSDIANRGIWGDTSTGILNRMDAILHVKPEKAFLMFGINDFFLNSTVDFTFDNYKKIIKQLRKAGIKVFVFSTLKCNINMVGRRCVSANQSIDTLNSNLKRFSDNNKIQFIDIDKKMSNRTGLNEKYTSDGIHLNLEGYYVWAGMIGSLTR